MKDKGSIIGFFIIVLVLSFLYSNTGSVTSIEQEVSPVEVVTPVRTEPIQNIVTETETSIEEVEEEVVQEPEEHTKADKIIAIAKTHIGVPYKMAGTNKNGFDCSGLVMTSFKKEGVLLPRASYEMAKKGKEVTLKDIKKGDLVFFITNPQRPNKISHVGLVTSVVDNVISFIHSSTKRGVIINTLDEKYYKNSYYKAKRIL